MAKQKVFLVDDDSDILVLNRDFLESEGYDVVTAASCAEALEKIKLHNFSCIVLDVMLPDGSAFDLAPKIAELHPVGLFDALAYSGGLAAAVSFDNNFGSAEKHASAVVLIIHKIFQAAEHRRHQSSSQLINEFGVNLFLKFAEKLKGSALGGLDQHVAAETVSNHHVVVAAQKVTASDVSLRSL